MQISKIIINVSKIQSISVSGFKSQESSDNIKNTQSTKILSLIVQLEQLKKTLNIYKNNQILLNFQIEKQKEEKSIRQTRISQLKSLIDTRTTQKKNLSIELEKDKKEHNQLKSEHHTLLFQIVKDYIR